MTATPDNDRRQRAREAFDDEWTGVRDMFSTAGWADRLCKAREVAIETATRVQITPEVLTAYVAARTALNSEQMHGRPPKSEHEKVMAGIIAAFRAAGFEVEQ